MTPAQTSAETVEGLQNLLGFFEGIEASHPDQQPHYPNGVRPWGTGDLRAVVETLSSAIAALTTLTRERDEWRERAGEAVALAGDAIPILDVLIEDRETLIGEECEIARDLRDRCIAIRRLDQPASDEGRG